MTNPRQLVVQTLCKMDRDSSWSNLAFDAALKKDKMPERDSAFAGALFYGVLERRLTLDACIAAHSSVKLRKLSPAVHNILRCGFYQLLYMDSVPDSAGVSESVELAKALHQAKSTGFINAVLRAFLRAGKALPPPASGALADRLSLAYSCPSPLVAMWLNSYGEERTRAILEKSLGTPPLTVRANTLRTTPEALLESLSQSNIAGLLHVELFGCLTLQAKGGVNALPAYREGLFHVQDKSSQLCALAVDPQPGMRVLDACAAPGGKSFTMAEMMEDRGELVAADLHPHRVKLIEDRMAELGITIIRTVCADLTKHAPTAGDVPADGAGPGADTRPGVGETGSFHRVLCDVPCSGLGVIRRKPEIKYRPLEEFTDFPEIQYKILENSAQYCMVGGLLVYSTCTLRREENEAVVQRFLEAHPEFTPHPLPPLLGGEWCHTLVDDKDTDGFFIARFQRG